MSEPEALPGLRGALVVVPARAGLELGNAESDFASMTEQARDEFQGTERFEVLEHLGSGGMGAVYSARDRDLDALVALKVLSRLDPAAIMRFKREFRALADVSHPSLVSLYELLFADGQWFFTMELINGVDLRAFVCGDDPAGLTGARTRVRADWLEKAELSDEILPGDTTAPLASEHRVPQANGQLPTRRRETRPLDSAGLGPNEPRTVAARDFVRLRHSMLQLAEGVHALHESGYLHCDIKPNNVLVSHEGRVVLLDFGLVTGVRERRDLETLGTPAYMSPEHMFGGDLTEASDWFSVGVVLYQLVTGRWPRAMSWARIYRASGHLPALPAPDQVRPGVPEDLNELCFELMRNEPAERPSGAEVLRRLGARRPSRRRMETLPETIGRSSQLAALDQALADLDRDKGSIVYVRGAAGMGKTTLIRRFLDLSARNRSAVVLAGRCYQREAIPHKTLDSVIDSLCRYLIRLSPSQIAALLPEEARSLARVFPVLERVLQKAANKAKLAEEHETEPLRVRRRASMALRKLLTAIAQRRRLVLFIDDLQWGDVDSVPLLEDLMRPPDTPRLLLILAHRIDDEGKSPALVRQLFTGYLFAKPLLIRTLDVAALSLAEAEGLARNLLHSSGRSSSAAHAIARESGGNPLFVHELVRYALSNPIAGEGALTLDAVLWTRLSRLDRRERELVELLAVAGRPLVVEVARAASELDAGELESAARVLSAVRLLHMSTDEVFGERLELHHDRIREIVVSHLDDTDVRRYSRLLAAAVAGSAVPDTESLAALHLDAGDRVEAARYAVLAARKAAKTLSFARAADLYERAIRLGEHTQDDERQLLIALGEMRQAAGHGRAAAGAFAAAVQLSSGLSALDLRRRAAGELLRAGHIASGLRAMAPVLAEVGVTLPVGRWRTLARLAYWRLRLRLRRLRFRPRDADAISPLQQMRSRACLDIAAGIVNFDPVLASALSAQAMVETLALGDRQLVIFVGELEISLIGVLGQLRWARQLLAFLEGVCDPTDMVERLSIARLQSILLLFSGHLAAASRRSREVLLALHTAPVKGDDFSLMWFRDMAAQYAAISLLIQLDFAEMRDTLPECLADAMQSGNRQATVVLRLCAAPLLWLNAGDPDGARRAADEAMEEWEQDGFQLPHFVHLVCLMAFDFYSGNGMAALRRWQEAEPAMRSSLLLRIPMVRDLAGLTRGVALVAAAIDGHPRANGLLRKAAREARKLRSVSMGWPRVLGEIVECNVELIRGDREAAMRRLAEAVRLADDHEFSVWAAYCQWVLGRLLGGARGAELVAESESRLARHETADLLSMSCTLFPALRNQELAAVRALPK